ncbi:hypothetical protein MTYP_02468 [Methylophilaceae bacterium]|nr:hypothetical protein MTYP_02468 [Methylophilaceae bacterium]
MANYNILVHFDGPIAIDHRVSVRTLGKTLDHIQSAIDRAYLDVKHGNVWKHARLKAADYEATEFVALHPREGGYILEMIKNGAESIVDRLNSAVFAAFEESLQESENEYRSLNEQAQKRLDHYRNRPKAEHFESLITKPDKRMIRAYGDRSIVKEIDQILSLVRNPKMEGSKFELGLYGSKAHPLYTFDAARAHAFHDVIVERGLGDPLLIPIELRSLDGGNKFQAPKGKAFNLETHRDFVLHIGSTEDFDKLVPFLQKKRKKQLLILGSPIVEYGAFDPYGGDVFFLDLLEAN